MGTWDTGSFCNDAALDFINGLSSSDMVISTLSTYRTAQDADEAAAVLASCDIIAAKLGRPAPEMPDEAASIVSQLRAPNDDTLKLARAAIAHLRAHSELAELWSEDDISNSDWQSTLDDLLLRLDLSQPYSAPDPQVSSPGEITGTCFICETSIPEDQIVDMVHQSDDGILSMTLYAHRACIEERYDPPHWTEGGIPSPSVLAQFAASLGLDD